MKGIRASLAVVAALAVLGGCATVPNGPSSMALPGSRKNFDEFRVDDTACRQYATDQIGGQSAGKTATDVGVSSAAIGTAVGAAAGALIGSASAAAGAGAAIGAGVGLFTGAAVGSDYASGAYYNAQTRYDYAYQQCMYAKGNKVPMSGHYARTLPTATRATPPASATPGLYYGTPPANAAIPPPNAPPPGTPRSAPPPNAAIPPPNTPGPR